MRPTRIKPCAHCAEPAPILYRVQLDESGQWYFVCDRCLPLRRDENPHYTYGGTWKAKKKR